MTLSRGFTASETAGGILGLILLVVAIVLPYYFRLQTHVKAEMVAWAGSALNVAVTLVRAQAKLKGATGGGSITIKKRPKVEAKIFVNKILNPAADSQGIVEAVEIPEAESELLISYEVEPGAKLVVFSIKDTARCKVTYREDLHTGEINILQDTTGCE